MVAQASKEPLRLFLDTGVLVDGFFNRWGVCKGVLILATLRQQFRPVLAESVLDELSRSVEKKTAALPSAERETIKDAIEQWHKIARLWPF